MWAALLSMLTVVAGFSLRYSAEHHWHDWKYTLYVDLMRAIFTILAYFFAIRSADEYDARQRRKLEARAKELARPRRG